MDAPLTLDAIFAACPSGRVSGASRRQYERTLQIVDDEKPETALKIWLVDFLRREIPDHGSGAWLWAECLTAPILEVLMRSISGIGATRAPALAIAGGRFVSMNWIDRPFDLAEGVFLDQLPDEVFETRVFNLRILYRSCLGRRDRDGSRSSHDLERSGHAGRMPLGSRR